MSRMEELRKKLRSEKPDFERIEFMVLLDTIANTYFNASTARGDKFRNDIYEKYKITNPDNKENWLKQQLDGCFKSIGDAPNWILEEDWLFYNEKPMIFVNQFKGDNDQIFYVFLAYDEFYYESIRRNVKKALYKMTAQDNLGILCLQGEIKVE